MTLRNLFAVIKYSMTEHQENKTNKNLVENEHQKYQDKESGEIFLEMFCKMPWLNLISETTCGQQKLSEHLPGWHQEKRVQALVCCVWVRRWRYSWEDERFATP